LILPSKHLRLEQSLLAGAAAVLVTLRSPLTVSSVWERVRDSEAIPTFDRFTLSLDLLFALGLVTLDSGRLRTVSP
jgi:hypothetical protein